jgi:hypothetical protein
MTTFAVFSLLKSCCVAEVVVTNGDIISQKEKEKGTMGTNILLVKIFYFG